MSDKFLNLEDFFREKEHESPVNKDTFEQAWNGMQEMLVPFNNGQIDPLFDQKESTEEHADSDSFIHETIDFSDHHSDHFFQHNTGDPPDTAGDSAGTPGTHNDIHTTDHGDHHNRDDHDHGSE